MSTCNASLRVAFALSSFALASPSLRAVEDLSAETKAAVSQPTADQVAFFEKHIRPVLVEHCYQCHSPRAPKLQGGLRLDTREKLRRGGDSGPVFAAGAPGKSLLIQAIRHDGLEMPPDKRLPDRIIVNFEKWVAMGAPDPRTGGARAGKLPHGTSRTRSLGVSTDPATVDSDCTGDRLGDFRYRPLHSGSVEHERNHAGKRRRSIYLVAKRVSFDLTGLPPTLEEMVDFVADEAPTAYHKVVDRLLGSRAFGERWSRYWLDLVGYADQRTAEAPMYAHHAWRYRDFVIDAFNNDVPFDHFTRQQLAGDLMPYKSIQERRENLIATGFLVLGDMRISDYDKMQLHVDTVDSQVSKVGKAFLGLTLGCARCHDHKFDPISHDDYYAIAGIFDSTSTLYRGHRRHMERGQRHRVARDPGTNGAAYRG